jgi:hypothetical protein
MKLSFGKLKGLMGIKPPPALCVALPPKPRDDSLDWLLSSMMWLFKGGDLGADRRPAAEAERVKRRARKGGSSS